jgi:hypothetical protein
MSKNKNNACGEELLRKKLANAKKKLALHIAKTRESDEMIYLCSLEIEHLMEELGEQVKN